MFQNGKITIRLYDPPFSLLFCSILKFALSVTVQFWPKRNIGTFQSFQSLADPHFGTLWNIAGHYTKHHY